MKIALEFDKDLIALAGTAHGNETWHTQVEPYKDEPQLTLEFPDQIECISTSFVSALLAQELEAHGLQYVKDKYKIESTHSYFEEMFWDCID